MRIVVIDNTGASAAMSSFLAPRQTLSSIYMSTIPVIPFLGSKRYHLELIRQNLPTAWNRCTAKYIEPFCGSAVVFQYLNPKRAIVSDASPFLMCMFRCLKHDKSRFLKALAQLYQTNSVELYQSCKTKVLTSSDEFERAAMFAYLQKTSLYSFTCPRMDHTAFRGAYKSTGKAIKLELSAWEALAGKLAQKAVELVESDFESIMDAASAGDFL